MSKYKQIQKVENNLVSALTLLSRSGEVAICTCTESSTSNKVGDTSLIEYVNFREYIRTTNIAEVVDFYIDLILQITEDK